MKRLLLIAPAAIGAALVALAVAPAAAVPALEQYGDIVLATAAGVACLLAAFSFESGDYLRTAWLANGASYFANAAIGWLYPGAPEPPVFLALRMILVVLTNLLGVLSVWLFANAYARAGLEHPGGRGRRNLVSLGALALALALGGGAFVEAVLEVRAGQLGSIVNAISSAGDIVIFVLLAPIAMTAFALRGGLLVWPWGFLLASNLSWLLFDAQASIGEYLPHGAWLVSWAGLWLVAASTLTVAAGLAQRRIARG